jgi:hypothetical protein
MATRSHARTALGSDGRKVYRFHLPRCGWPRGRSEEKDVPDVRSSRRASTGWDKHLDKHKTTELEKVDNSW